MKKKKVIIAMACLALSAAMIFPLTGCSKNGGSMGNASGLSAELADVESSKDSVFAEKINFTLPFSPTEILTKGNQVLLFFGGYNYDNGESGDLELKWAICDADGNIVKEAADTVKGTEGVIKDLQDVNWNDNGEIMTVENFTSENGDMNYIVNTYSEDGNEIGTVESTVPANEATSCAVLTESGDLAVVGMTQLFVFDKTGKPKTKIPYGMNYEPALIRKVEAGNVCVVLFDENYNSHVLKINIADSKVSDLGMMDYSVARSLMVDEEGKLYGTTHNGISKLSINDTEVTQEEILNYMDSDIDSSNVGEVKVLNAENVVLAQMDPADYSTSAVSVFSKVAPEDIKEKQIIVLGSLSGVYGNLQKKILDFNKTNDKYRIRVADYSVYSETEEGYDAMGAENQLKKDLITKCGPDIIMTTGILNMDMYTNKGVFADLNPYFERNGINKSDYFENVLKAGEKDGKLYYVAPHFAILSFEAKKSVMGDKTTLSYDELKELEEKYGCKGSSMMVDRATLLRYMMLFSGNTYYDLVAGECHFDSEEFVDFLEMMKEYPAQDEVDYLELYNNREQRCHDNQVLLSTTSLQDFTSFNADEQVMFGEELMLLGFPGCKTGSGVIYPTEGFAVSADSRYPDAAFDIVKYFISEEYQMPDESLGSDEYVYANGFPLMKKAYNRIAEMATEKPYYYENGEKIVKDLTTYSVAKGGEVVIDPIKKDRVDYITKFVENSNITTKYDQKIADIIEEEAAFYFAGQKSPEEVSEVIQSRVQNYIRESQ